MISKEQRNYIYTQRQFKLKFSLTIPRLGSRKKSSFLNDSALTALRLTEVNFSTHKEKNHKKSFFS